jgi:hypothetical protein
MDGLPSSRPFHTRFLWIFALHCEGPCACVGCWCAACVWSQAHEQTAQRVTRREKERCRGKAMETSLRYGTGEKQLLLHAKENFLLDSSFYLQVCISFRAKSCIVRRSLFAYRISLLRCVWRCGMHLNVWRFVGGFFLYFLSGSIVVCWLSIWLPRFFLPAPSRLNSGMHAWFFVGTCISVWRVCESGRVCNIIDFSVAIFRRHHTSSRSFAYMRVLFRVCKPD